MLVRRGSSIISYDCLSVCITHPLQLGQLGQRNPQILVLLQKLFRVGQPESVVLLLVLKHIPQVMDHADGIFRNALVVMAQPDQDVLGALVDGVHQADLAAALCNVVLVNAHLVGPQPPRQRRVPHAPQRSLDALRQRERASIAEHLGAAALGAPDIGDGLVAGVEVEVLDSEAANQRLVGGARLQGEDAHREVVLEGGILVHAGSLDPPSLPGLLRREHG